MRQFLFLVAFVAGYWIVRAHVALTPCFEDGSGACLWIVLPW